MRPSMTLALTLAAGIAAGAIGGSVLNAQPAPVRETALLRTDLAGLKGMELIMSRLETAPGWSHGWHHHPGHEVVYALRGAGIIEVDGKPPVTLKPGAASYVPPGQVHAGRNASRTAPSEFLLVRIHEKGQPISIESPSAGR